jgi:uncharacterized protein YbjQ (UPF0145 family)
MYGCSTLGYIPGKDIKASLGIVEYRSSNSICSSVAELKTILQELLDLAIENGGHAVINVKVVTGTSPDPIAGERHYIQAYGEAVLLK